MTGSPATNSKRLYLDHAATSFPKAPGVVDAMVDYQTRLGASPGRGAYAEARESARLLTECRARICELIHGEDPNHVIFTLNTSDALNLAIHGLVRPGDHVITTAMDHNSILRPFNALVERDDVTQTRVPCDPQTGLVDPAAIEAALREHPQTRLVAVIHGSNVTGTVQPIAAIGQICRERAVPLLVDAAQTCGHLPIDVQRDAIDLLAAPGHKGLLGPLGTGFLYIRPGLEKSMRTVRQGGTGSRSELDVQPDFMPDRFESGSHNAIGIAGLRVAVGWLLEQGAESLWRHHQLLVREMIHGLTGEGLDAPGEPIDGLTLYGPLTVANRCGVFSIRMDGFDDPLVLAQQLESDHGLLTRPGIHCAPHAHATIGTSQLGGTTRLSLGTFTTLEDVREACAALRQVAAQSRRSVSTSAC